ncbi:hypothetical protein ABEW00_12570 [Rossellomorea vietnamensis]|uniref:hypothetical protein n=1 Tax=Rossellomorea vietnamensis TaxID=218284 RepID=UPI003D294E38
MTWIVVIVSFFILIVLSEELVYHLLRTRIMEGGQAERKKSAGKIKEWLHKMKLIPNNGQQNH